MVGRSSQAVAHCAGTAPGNNETAARGHVPVLAAAGSLLSRNHIPDLAGTGLFSPIQSSVHHPKGRTLCMVSTRERQVIHAAYASDLEAFVESCGAALWIHGHIHRRNQYRIGRTRVVCNPRGYPDQTASGFDPRLVRPP